MENSKKIIPFWIWPLSWGAKGKTRQIAEAEYYLTGYELDLELAKIHGTPKLDVDLKHNMISEQDHAIALAEAMEDSDEKELAKLEIEKKFNKLSDFDYDKQKAEILKKPWCSMPNIHWDPKNTKGTYFELDYNTYFIEYLKDNGYNGEEQDIVDIWLNDVCISVLEDTNGFGADLATPSRREPEKPKS